jgi:hypothetical protein
MTIMFFLPSAEVTYAQDSFWGEMIETYVLFGDPAMRLGLPAPSLRLGGLKN